MNFLLSKTGIATILLIAVFSFLYFFTGVFGDTRIGVTISTNPDLEDGLVAHYTFDGVNVDRDDVGTEIKDTSGNGNHADLESETEFRSGKVGQSLYLNGGEDDEVRASDSSSFDTVETNNTFTVAAWFRWEDDGSGYMQVVGRDSYTSQHAIYIERDSQGIAHLCFAGANAGFDVCNDVDQFIYENRWYHVAITYDQQNARQYIDGVEIISSGTTNALPSTIFDLCIGAGGTDCGNDDFAGDIDDVRLYNRALSADEVERIYHLGATTKVGKTIDTNLSLKEGLAGHWTFDGADVFNVVTDLSSNANDGYLVSSMATGTAVLDGVIGQALAFDGADDYIEIQDSSVFDIADAGEYSWTGWFRSDDTSADWPAGIGVTGNGLQFFLVYVGQTLSDGRLPGGDVTSGVSLFVGSAGTNQWIFNDSFDNTITEGVWHHVAALYDGSQDVDERLTIYVDGVNVTSATAETGHPSNPLTDWDPNDIWIGDNQNDANEEFDGGIDNVRYYDRLLSADEVKRIYQLGATTKIAKTIETNPDLTDGLVSHWSFDGASIQDEVSDNSGNSISGYFPSGEATSSLITSGPIGQGLVFDGTDDEVDFPTAPDYDDDATIALWLYIETAQNMPVVYLSDGSNNDFFKIMAFSDGDMQCQADNTYDTGATAEMRVTYPTNEWFHFAAVKGTNTCDNIFINGESVYQYQANFDSAGVNATRLGRDDESAYFEGRMDDVRLYNRQLSTSSIERIYGLGR